MPLAKRCAWQFDRQTQTRGRNYAAAHAVEIVEFDDDYALANVAGTRSYDVTVDWSDEEEGVLNVDCSCPRFDEGNLCKHVWATLLTVDEACSADSFSGPSLTVQRLEDELDEGPFFLSEDESDDDVEMDRDGRRIDLWNPLLSGSGRAGNMQAEEESAPAMLDGILDMLSRVSDAPQSDPAARRGTAGPAPSWMGPFRELHRQSFAEQLPRVSTGSVQRASRAWYALDIAQSASSSQFTVDLLYQQQKKDGDYGKCKRLTFDSGMVDEFADPVDRDLLMQLLVCGQEQLRSPRPYYAYRAPTNISTLQIPAALQRYLLPRLAASGRLVRLADDSDQISAQPPITWDDAPWELRLRLESDDAKQVWNLRSEFCRAGETLPATGPLNWFFDSQFGGILLTRTTLAPFQSQLPIAWLNWVVDNTPLEVPYADRDQFLRLMWSAPQLPPIDWPDNLALAEIAEPPEPCLRVQEARDGRARGRLTADVRFLYGDNRVAADDLVSGFLESAGDGQPPSHVRLRHRDSEQARMRDFLALPAVQEERGWDGDRQLYIKQHVLSQIVSQLLSDGWRVEAGGKPFRHPGEFQMDVQSGVDWFDLNASIDFGGVQAQLPELLAAVRKGERFVELGDGSRGILPEDWLKKYTSLAELGETTDGAVRFKRSQALLLDSLLAEHQNLRTDTTFQKFRKRLQSFQGVAPKNAPRTFRGTLRSYQREGLGWFQFLDNLGVGGCLADDMGLGKTVQVLALLEALRTRRPKEDDPRRPSLAVVPKSLIFNWIDEAARFTPRLKVVNYTGTARAALRSTLDEAHLVLTTYGTLRRDIVDLKDQPFELVILDEAQAIKNASSQAAKACLLLQARRRLALTGTPVENHLGELWSLFEFLNPGMLGHSRAFAAVCKDAGRDDSAALHNLARAIAPFVLRRTKEQVLTELPQKTEQTLYCELPPKDRKAYNELRDFYRAKLSKVIDAQGLRQSKFHVLEALLRLRQAACHFGLIDRQKTQQPSAKLDTLLEQLQEIIGEGHKALVFSQFTSLLAIVRERLDRHAICYEYLDGQTRNRKQIVDRFQQDNHSSVFLISLKAGGQGLNLTAADYVYILDPWWNPAVEMQAIDRAHRIGQSKPVFAYRIIARDTVEEKVLELQQSKRELADAIITANDSLIRKMTSEDLQRILS